MLEKIKKYKFLFLLLFLLFIFFSNNVNANSDSITYNDTTINTMYFNQHQNSFLIYDKIDNKYLSFELFRTSSSSNSNPRFYIVREDKDYMYISGRSNQYFFNCTAIYNYDISSGTIGSVSSSINYGGNTSSTNSNNASYKIDKNRFSFVYKADNVKIYTDETCITEISTSEFFFANIDNSFILEYNENLNSYVVYSQWYPITDDNMYLHQHYYQLNSDNLSFEFNFDTKEIDGWFNMEGNDNGVGPGLEYLIEDVTSENINDQRWRVGLQIIDYGTYYFCHYLPFSDNKDYEIMKFVFNEDGSCYIFNYDKNTGNWNSFETIENINFSDFSMHVVYDNYSAIIYSNFFRYDDRYVYTVSYSYDGINYSDDILTEDFGIDIPNNKAGYYRYYKEVTENRTYYFRLQIFDPENNGFIVDTKYIEVTVDGNFYLNSSYNDVSFYRKSSVYRILKNKLGILFYPIDITFEFFERLSKIETQEPSITVPTVREFFTNTVIINGFTFNLNDVLQNNTINNVYNIYLMFVDFIIYSFLFILLYKVFKEFFNIGGLFND